MAHAQNGSDGGLPEAEDKPTASAAQDVSVPAAGQGDHKAKPCVVCRHHIYSDAARFIDLVAIMDWHSRAVLSWRVSNTMDADFCGAALEDAINRYGVPEIFNTDQGSTSYEFTKTLREAGARISMDDRGRWMDNVMIERLWRPLQYECLYLREIATGSELCRILAWWLGFYNNRRPHKTFDGRKPVEIYQQYKPEGVPPLISPRWAA